MPVKAIFLSREKDFTSFLSCFSHSPPPTIRNSVSGWLFTTISMARIAISISLNPTNRPLTTKALPDSFTPSPHLLQISSDTPVSIIRLHLSLYLCGMQARESSVRKTSAFDALHALRNHGFVTDICLLTRRIHSTIICLAVRCGHRTPGTPSPPPRGPHIKGSGNLYINVGSHIVPKVTAKTSEYLCSFIIFFAQRYAPACQSV